MKPGLAVTQKNADKSGFICQVQTWNEFQGTTVIVQFVVKKSIKWQKPVMQKIRKGKHRYLWNICGFIELKCLHKCLQLYEWSIFEININFP